MAADQTSARDDFVEAVLSLVEQIPAGKVCTYGDVAELLGRGGPRNVGQVMSIHGGAVPWWRVIRADGRPVAGLEAAALDRLRGEGVVFTGRRGDRVDLGVSRWDADGLTPIEEDTNVNGRVHRPPADV